MSILYILAGFVILVFGGETLVNGSVAVARRLNMPSLVIGVVLVGFGTSTPELVTSIEAGLQNSPGIVVGNIIGSNIANVLLVAGAGALVLPMVRPAGFMRDSLVLTAATALFIGVAFTGTMTRGMGVLFVAMLVIYLAYLIVSEQRRHKAQREAVQSVTFEQPVRSLPVGAAYAIAGIGMTILGAKLLVMGATEIALELGVSETVIGLTIVAIGTSLPEMATAIVAGRKGETDVAMGNIMGSNIYNILAILGITALVKPIAIAPEILRLDIWVLTAAMALVIILPLWRGQINRRTGSVFLAAYGAYLCGLYLMA